MCRQISRPKGVINKFLQFQNNYIHASKTKAVGKKAGEVPFIRHIEGLRVFTTRTERGVNNSGTIYTGSIIA
jgi:hypothetical protein